MEANPAINKLIFDQIPSIFAVTNKDGLVVDCNKAFTEAFKLTTDEVLGRRLEDVIFFSASIQLSSELSDFLNQSITKNKQFSNACLDFVSGFSYHADMQKILQDTEVVGILFLFTPSRYTRWEMSAQRNSNLQKQNDALLTIAKSNVFHLGNLEKSFEVILSIACDVLGLDCCSIWQFHEDNLVCNKLYNRIDATFSLGTQIPIVDFPNYVNLIKSGTILDVEDVLTDFRTIELTNYFEQNGIQSLLDSPIRVSGNIYGVLCCEVKGTNRSWEIEEKIFAGYLSEIITHTINSQKEADTLKQIQKRELYFKTLIENSYDVVAIVNAEAVFTYVSNPIQRVLGYTESDLLGKTPFEFMHPSEVDNIFYLFNTMINNKEDAIYTVARIRNKIGEYRHIEGTTQNLLELEGVNAIVLNFRDITDRILADQELLKKEQYFRSLIENSMDAISIIDDQGMRTYVSPSTENVYGYPIEELYGHTPFTLIHPDDIERAIQLFQEIKLYPNRIEKLQLRAMHSKGYYMDIEITARNMLFDPVVKGVILNSRDVTERNRFQQQLELSEKYFRALIENSNDMISICDELGKVFYVSPSIERYLGYSPDEYLAISTKELVHPNYKVPMRKVFSKTLINPRATFKEELYIKHKDGYYIYVEILYYNLLNDSAVKGIVMISRDITDRKEAEQLLRNYNIELEHEVNAKTRELKNKNTDLENLLSNLKNTQAQLVQSEKMASLGMLTAGIAHEINNPINFITANIKPLRRDIQSIKEMLDVYDTFPFVIQEKDLKTIKEIKNELEIEYSLQEIDLLLRGIEEGATRTSEIVQGLRTFTRVDESSLAMVDLNQNINTTLMLLQSSFQGRIKIVKNYAKLPPIECYPGKLNQVFMNILSNAGQAIKEKGQIEIHTSLEEADKVRILIKDNGNGMSAEVMDKIFEPFYTTKPVGEGTGLGLFISFGIIENHHGKIQVQSDLGEGTTFIITLPIRQ